MEVPRNTIGNLSVVCVTQIQNRTHEKWSFFMFRLIMITRTSTMHSSAYWNWCVHRFDSNGPGLGTSIAKFTWGIYVVLLMRAWQGIRQVDANCNVPRLGVAMPVVKAKLHTHLGVERQVVFTRWLRQGYNISSCLHFWGATGNPFDTTSPPDYQKPQVI